MYAARCREDVFDPRHQVPRAQQDAVGAQELKRRAAA